MLPDDKLERIHTEAKRLTRDMPELPPLRDVERFTIYRTLLHVRSTAEAAKILQISPRKVQYEVRAVMENNA